MKTFSDHGIVVPNGATGDIKVFCPRCQQARQKNRNDKSLSVNVRLGVWKCHHCGWTGGLIGGGGRPQKVYTRPVYDEIRVSRIPANVVEWFQEKRGIPVDILTANKITANDNGTEILFPYFKGGECVNIKHRKAGKQMFQEKGAEPCFFNHDGAMACEEKHFLIITEGEIDCLAVQAAGFPFVVSVPAGANSATDELFINEESLIEAFKQVIVFGDNDEKGRQLELELLRRIGPDRCYRVKHPEGCKDANDVLLKFGAKGVVDVITGASPAPIEGLYAAGDVLGELLELYDQGDNSGMSTGWQAFDKLYTVRPCEMTIVTGIPSHGKSTWLDALIVNLWTRYGFKACYCSPENWPIQRHISSLIENIVGKPFGKCDFANERMSKEEAAAAVTKIESSFYFVMLDEEDMAVDTILKRMRASIYRYGVNGIILDPWNEIEQQRPQGMTETEFVSQTLGKIRRFARTNGVHVWIVAHPTKMQKDKDTGHYLPPRLYDVSGSAHFYNKADNGITVYRVPDADETQVYVNKVRFKEVGSPGVQEFIFNKKINRFKEKDSTCDNTHQGRNDEDEDDGPPF